MDILMAWNELLLSDDNNLDPNKFEILNLMMRIVKTPDFKNDFIGPRNTYLLIEGYPFKLFIERICFEDGFYRSLLKTSWKRPQKMIEPIKYLHKIIDLPAVKEDLGEKYFNVKNGLFVLCERILQNL